MEQYDDPRITAFGMLIEAHNEAVRVVEHQLAELDLPHQFASVLIRLIRTPGNELRMTDLATDMTISTSGLTRLVDRMETAGLVERRSCPKDRRGLNVTLTAAGHRQAAAMAAPHLAALELAVGRHLTAAQLEQLTDLLRKIRDGNRSGA